MKWVNRHLERDHVLKSVEADAVNLANLAGQADSSGCGDLLARQRACSGRAFSRRSVACLVRMARRTHELGFDSSSFVKANQLPAPFDVRSDLAGGHALR